jgi:hypothetical protein
MDNNQRERSKSKLGDQRFNSFKLDPTGRKTA